MADEIVGITDSVCLSVLDEEYADLAGRAVAKLARKRPSPLQAGRRATEAFRRGLIPYIPALGPDETAARASSQMTGTPHVASAAAEVFPHAGGRPASLLRDAVADVAAPSGAAGPLDHCSDLKRQLVEFARFPALLAAV